MKGLNRIVNDGSVGGEFPLLGDGVFDFGLDFPDQGAGNGVHSQSFTSLEGMLWGLCR